MIPIHPDSAWQGTADCRNCGIRDMVLFADLNEQDFNQIHTPIDDLVYGADAVLYHEGAKALGVFTLRKGLVKLVRSTADGRERIVRVLRLAYQFQHVADTHVVPQHLAVVVLESGQRRTLHDDACLGGAGGLQRQRQRQDCGDTEHGVRTASAQRGSVSPEAPAPESR